jgi:hypothetical protein
MTAASDAITCCLNNENRKGGIFMDNYRYTTLSEAVKIAITRCDKWRFATADEFYERASLQRIAQVHDEETYLDEDSFYVVSPGGAIGFSEDGDTIDWLFLPLDSTEELPLSFEVETIVNFCLKCGSRVTPNWRFCGSCGAKL